MSRWCPVYVPEIEIGRHVKNNACAVEIKIKWMIRKHMTYENTYRDDILISYMYIAIFLYICIFDSTNNSFKYCMVLAFFNVAMGIPWVGNLLRQGVYRLFLGVGWFVKILTFWQITTSSFLARLVKGNVSFCHHLSVVC
jgi:hypothetical protein